MGDIGGPGAPNETGTSNYSKENAKLRRRRVTKMRMRGKQGHGRCRPSVSPAHEASEEARERAVSAELPSGHFSPAAAPSMHTLGCPTLLFRRRASCPGSRETSASTGVADPAAALGGFGRWEERTTRASSCDQSFYPFVPSFDFLCFKDARPSMARDTLADSERSLTSVK